VFNILAGSFRSCPFSSLLAELLIVLTFFKLAEMDVVLGAFANLRKATISFVMSVCLPLRMEQLGCHWTIFMKFDIWLSKKKY